MALGVVSGSDVMQRLNQRNVHQTWSTYWSVAQYTVPKKAPIFEVNQ